MHKTDGFFATTLYGLGLGLFIALLAFLLFIFLEADSASTTQKEYQYEKDSKGNTIYRKNIVMRGNFDENIPVMAALIGFCVGVIAIYVLRYVPMLPSIENLLDAWAGVEKK
jgi:hypothetical protein